jgi:single-strand DNA-binding protein
MANDLNQCSFIGRLGRDPEMRHTGAGDAVTSFSLACGWKTKDKEGTEWVNIVTFGKLAEICDEYLKKGSQVFVQGRMRTRDYEKDGVKRYVTEIVAETMQMLGSKPDSDGNRSQSRSSGRPAPSFSDMDDAIPF